MQTSTLAVNDLAINVYESDGKGPGVLFIHGNSASGRTFKPQLDSVLGEQYHMVALDLPGHGHSERAKDPAVTYNLPGYAKVVAEVARQLNLLEAVIVGWSLGGHIALEVAALLPQAKGLVIYGTPPIGIPPAMDKAFLPNPAMGSALQSDLSEADIQAFGAASLKPGDTVGVEFFEDVAHTDGQARANLAISLGSANYTDEVELVANLTRPLAVVHGELEQLISEPYISSLKIPTLWRGAVQIVRDAGHTTHQEQPEQFNALLEAFLKEAV